MFYLENPLHFENDGEEEGCVVDGTVTMTRQKENVRLYNVNIAYRAISSNAANILPNEQQYPYKAQVYEIP